MRIQIGLLHHNFYSTNYWFYSQNDVSDELNHSSRRSLRKSTTLLMQIIIHFANGKVLSKELLHTGFVRKCFCIYLQSWFVRISPYSSENIAVTSAK